MGAFFFLLNSLREPPAKASLGALLVYVRFSRWRGVAYRASLERGLKEIDEKKSPQVFDQRDWDAPNHASNHIRDFKRHIQKSIS